MPLVRRMVSGVPDARPLAGRRQVAVMVALGALSALGPLSMDMYLPALPMLGKSLGAADSVTQLTVSVCMVGLAVGQLIGGPLSDRFGRRRPLFLGVIAFTLSSALCAVAPNIWVLIVFRLMQGLAGGFGVVIARAMVRDMFEGAQAARVFSTLMLVSGLAPVLAPLAGGLISRLTDWRGLFLALAIVGLMLLAATVSLPETLREEARRRGGLRAVGADMAILGRDRHYVACALVVALSCVALFTYISLGSFVLQNGYRLTSQEFSAVFAVNAVGMVACGNVNRLALRRLTPRRMLACGICGGLVGGAVACAAVVLGWGLPGLLSGLFICMAVTGLALPNATAMSLERHSDRAGSASAVVGLLQFSFGAVMTVTMLVSYVAALIAFAWTGPVMVRAADGQPLAPGPHSA